MKFRRFLLALLCVMIGIATVCMAYLQDGLIYPPPEQLSQEHYERQRVQNKLRSARRLAPDMKATMMISPRHLRGRLDDAAEILIEIRNAGPIPFYFTTQRDPSGWTDMTPHNFQVLVLPRLNDCERTVTIRDT